MHSSRRWFSFPYPRKKSRSYAITHDRTRDSSRPRSLAELLAAQTEPSLTTTLPIQRNAYVSQVQDVNLLVMTLMKKVDSADSCDSEIDEVDGELIRRLFESLVAIENDC